MKRVEIREIALCNFKGKKELRLSFDNQFCNQIIGRNASGKSTIYDAYMWCIFNKGADGGEIKVCPLDSDNNVIPKIEVSVKLTLSAYDDNGIKSIVTVERRQNQVWQVKKGSTQEIFKGYEQTRLFNDVPYSVVDFNTKLNGIASVQDWLSLSCIGKFMQLPQDERRRVLIKAAGGIDPFVIAKPYPAVLKALNARTDVNDLQRANRQNRLRAVQELDDVPVRKDQIEKMKVEMDFAAVEGEIKVKESEIKAIEDKINCLVTDDTLKEYQVISDRLKVLTDKYNDRVNDIKADEKREVAANQRNIDENDTEVRVIRRKIRNLESDLESETVTLDTYRNTMKSLEASYKEVRARVFEAPEVMEICPTCGAIIPHEKIEETIKAAEEKFNTDKAQEIKRITEKAASIKAKADEVKNRIAEYESKIKGEKENADTLESSVIPLKEKMAEIKSRYADMMDNDKELALILQEKQELSGKLSMTKKDTTAEKREELSAEKRRIRVELDGLISKLAKRDVNKKADEMLLELEKNAAVLADRVAECDNIESQILAYKKARINAVEDSVSGLFSMVTWKMYEQNITNDGEREICQALIEGIPYEVQNNATRVKACVDIANGLGKAFGLLVPCWIDNKESVSGEINGDMQIITLSVVDGEDLRVL